MTVLTFVLGIALAVAGVVSIVSGVPYLRVEWGWTEVIAGATLLSGGIVTVALGAVLSGLDRIRRALDNAALLPRPDDEFAQAPRDDARDAASDPDTLGPEISLGDAPAPGGVAFEGANAGLATDPHAAQPPVLPEAAVPEAATIALGSLPPLQDGEPKTPRPMLRRFNWRRDKPGAGGEGTATNPEANLPPGSPPSDDRPAGGRIVPESPASLEDGPPSGDRPRTSGETAAEAPALPTVVGRYQAGTASYVLFSNGTIEVETDTGLHRFGSMDELKRFIGSQPVTAAEGKA